MPKPAVLRDFFALLRTAIEALGGWTGVSNVPMYTAPGMIGKGPISVAEYGHILHNAFGWNEGDSLFHQASRPAGLGLPGGSLTGSNMPRNTYLGQNVGGGAFSPQTFSPAMPGLPGNAPISVEEYEELRKNAFDKQSAEAGITDAVYYEVLQKELARMDAEKDLIQAENPKPDNQMVDIENTGSEAYNKNSDDDIASLSLRFMSNRDTLYQNIQNVPPLEGYEDIACHADPYGFGFVDPDTGETVQEVSAKFLVDRIKESGKYQGGDVRLLACSSGKLDDGLAQQFANEIGRNVLAPIKDIYTNSQGYMVVANSLTEAAVLLRTAKEKWNPEGWRIFKPKG